MQCSGDRFGEKRTVRLQLVDRSLSHTRLVANALRGEDSHSSQTKPSKRSIKLSEPRKQSRTSQSSPRKAVAGRVPGTTHVCYAHPVTYGHNPCLCDPGGHRHPRTANVPWPWGHGHPAATRRSLTPELTGTREGPSHLTVQFPNEEGHLG